MPAFARWPAAALIPFVLVAASGRLTAQTVDWARTTVGVTIGEYDGYALWSVPDQTVLSSNAPNPLKPDQRFPPDVFSLQRRVNRGITFGVHATRYVGYHLGLTAELGYIGNSPRTSCSVVTDGGDPELARACAAVGSNQKFGAGTDRQGYHDASGSNQTGGTMTLQAGAVLRPFRPGLLAPFIRGTAGFAQIAHSTVALETTYASDEDSPVVLTIYNDYAWHQIHFMGSLGVGIMTAPLNGMVFSLEARETFLGQSIVTGATSGQGQQPTTSSSMRAVPLLVGGFEIALGRQRGKRY